MSGLAEPPIAYAPEFMARVRQRLHAPPSVQVVYSGADAAMLRAAAEERRVTPVTMAKALMAKLRADDLVSAVMDGESPQLCAAGHARGEEGLTLTQGAILATVARNRDADGICRLSHEKIGIICADTAASTVGSALGALRRQKLIQRDASEKNPRQPAWRLTVEGRRLFMKLMGES